MTHEFVVNTENVNEYKYWILTSGIDFTQYLRNPVVLYLHERDSKENKGSEVIGRCVSLVVKGTDLIATIEFDEEDPFASTIAGKVKRGFLRMASLFADVKETSTDPAFIKEGQLYATVTKCKLVELSIVPIGGNDDALKLSLEGGTIKLEKLNLNKTENMSQFKTIALALQLSPETDETALLQHIQKIKLDKEKAEATVAELKKQIADSVKEEGTELIDKAVALGLLPDAFKAVQLSAYEADPVGQKAILSKLITEKEGSEGQSNDHSKIKEVVLNGKTGVDKNNDQQESFDYLKRFDTVKLAKIKNDDPAKYQKLVDDYNAGIRHNPTK